MEQKISWNEIKSKFPNEWVALIEYHQKDAEEIEGIVITHHPDRREFHEKIAKLLPTHRNMAVRFTGNLIKNPEIPYLWQISPIG
jgi:hypothetical protein